MNSTFITDRLKVYPRQFSDLEQCLAMDKDPLVTQYIHGPWNDPLKHRAFVTKKIKTQYPEGFGYWSVFNRLEKEKPFLGWVLLLPYHLCEGEVEIGWRFVRNSWGKGYATEAASIILDYGLTTMKLPKVVADINPLNRASLRVAEKLGMYHAENRTIDGELAYSYQVEFSK